MISLGRGIHALSMVMQTTMPAYPQVEITERTNEVTGLRMVSSKRGLGSGRSEAKHKPSVYSTRRNEAASGNNDT